MTRKFWIRTLRNVVLRKRPYFAHLALTHVCNLHCSFCHIPEYKVQELDTDGMKRVVDKLDQMGIAYLSISGGGEPLIRKDFADDSQLRGRPRHVRQAHIERNDVGVKV